MAEPSLYQYAGAGDNVATHLQWHIERENIDTRNGPQLAELVKLLGERCKNSQEEGNRSCRYFYEDFSEFDATMRQPSPGNASTAGSGARQAVGDYGLVSENVHHAIQATADELEVGMGKVGMPLRVAVTGAGAVACAGCHRTCDW